MTNDSHPPAEKQAVDNVQVALDLAEQGYSVFTCYEDDRDDRKVKSPIGKWRDNSTTDRDRIEKYWFGKNAKAAVGFDLGKSRLLVIDCDRHSDDPDDDGVAAFAAIMDENGFHPDTCPIVATPNNGIHFYFKLPEGQDHGNSTGNLPAGIDVRGNGGYVIAGETVMGDGRFYELVGDISSSPVVPEWLWIIIKAEKAVDMPAKGGDAQSGQKEPESPVVAEPVGDAQSMNILDGANLDELQELLSYVPADCEYTEWVACLMAVHAGSGGSQAGFMIADYWSSKGSKYEGSGKLQKKWASFKGVGVNSQSLAAIAKKYDADLRAIALKHNDFNQVSSQEVARSAEIVNNIIARDAAKEKKEVEAREEQEASSIKATPYEWVEPDNLPKRQWLYGKSIVRRYVSITVAPGGVGKSMEAICKALAMVTGRKLLNEFVLGKLRVWYFNLEDPMEELQLRIQATCQHYDISPKDIGGRLFIDSGRDQELRTATTTRTGTVIHRPVVEKLIAEIKHKNIDALIIDPFVSSHSVSENDNNAIDMVAKEWARVAQTANCAIHLIHHSRKMGSDELNAESSRGAKALVDAARDVRVINRMTKDEAGKAGVENHRSFVCINSDKGNLAPPSNGRQWYEIKSVVLPNSESVGVIAPWSWPNAFDGITTADLKKAQAAVGEKMYRHSSQAKEWIGHVIGRALGIETGEGRAKKEMTPSQIAGRTKVTSLLKVWIENEAFVIEEGLDSSRKKVDFVRVGDLCDE